jgi:hypothetical protein
MAEFSKGANQFIEDFSERYEETQLNTGRKNSNIKY